jgi:aconitase B
MPLDMPESILVRSKGQMQPGITLRDLLHAIPLYAIKAGLLTVAKAGKDNASKLGRIPTVAEYAENMGVINKDSSQIYQYLNFDQLEEYAEVAKGVTA